MKLVFTHDSIIQLHSAKNYLALNGIESFVKNEHSIPNGARHGIENTFLELWIPNDEDFDRAEALIAEQFVGHESKPEWTCVECHESNDGSFEFCWNCQSAAQSDTPGAR